MNEGVKPLFTLGRVVVTPIAVAAVEKSAQQLGEFLERDVSGDSREAPPKDINENDFSLRHDFGLLSGESFYI